MRLACGEAKVSLRSSFFNVCLCLKMSGKGQLIKGSSLCIPIQVESRVWKILPLYPHLPLYPQLIHILSNFNCLLYELYLTNHHSSQENARYGTSCLSFCFPESYNLPSFKSKINKLDPISLSSWPFAFFFVPLLGLCIGHHGLSPT